MGRKRTSAIWRMPKDELECLVENSKTMADVLRYFGLENKGGNNRTLKKRLNEDEIDYSKYAGNYGIGLIKPLIHLDEILI